MRKRIRTAAVSVLAMAAATVGVLFGVLFGVGSAGAQVEIRVDADGEADVVDAPDPDRTEITIRSES